MPHNMVTLQAWRLENTNGTHYKQYTVLADSRHVLFFNSRIGNSWVNQTPKAHVSDPLGKARSQMRSKQSGGYDIVWQGDVTLPEQWVENPGVFARQIQDFAEDLYRQGASIGIAHDAPTTAVPSRGTPGLDVILDECRNMLSKMAVDPDTAINDYPKLVGQYEEVRNQMDVVEGYMDTMRLMLAGQEVQG